MLDLLALVPDGVVGVEHAGPRLRQALVVVHRVLQGLPVPRCLGSWMLVSTWLHHTPNWLYRVASTLDHPTCHLVLPVGAELLIGRPDPVQAGDPTPGGQAQLLECSPDIHHVL